MRLLLIFFALPFLELWVLIGLGRQFGLLPTLALVLGAGVVGAALARHQGLRLLTAIGAELNAGRMPAKGMLDAAGLLLAGGLFLLPGLISDVLGLALLLPPLRRAVVLWGLGWSSRRVAQGVRDGTITVHAVRLEPDWQQSPGRIELMAPRDEEPRD